MSEGRELVLNGAKMWAGTMAQKTDDGWEITTPSAEPRLLSVADELVLNGQVVNGPLAGFRRETRQVYPTSGHRSKLLRDCYYKGEHGPGCVQTEDGWVCRRRDCTVEDVPSQPTYNNSVDSLVDVLEEIERQRLRVFWTLSRRSTTRRFVNGRCVLPDGEVYKVSVFHEGRTWTKWGARRQIAKIDPEERERYLAQ